MGNVGAERGLVNWSGRELSEDKGRLWIEVRVSMVLAEVEEEIEDLESDKPE